MKTALFACGMVLYLAAASFAAAQTSARQDAFFERELDRGALPDTTPQARYQTAARDAGGGYKLSVQTCNEQAAAQRKDCYRAALETYNREMAAARELLRPETPAQTAPAATRADDELRKTEVPDLTPQQRHRTALREAGAALQEARLACAAEAPAARAECQKLALEAYQRDSAEARELLAR